MEKMQAVTPETTQAGTPTMRVQRILTLDGGGIRGLVSAIWLEALQAKLHAAGKGALHEHFDLIAGSSTGALIAMGLASGMPAKDITTLYEHFGDDVFPGAAERLWSRVTRSFTQGLSAPRYSPKGLERVLKRVFSDRTLGSVAPRAMAIAYDTVARTPLFFKSFKPEHADIPLWEVCRAATAAPTYFPAHLATIERRRRALIDGGVVANNPTACAIAEAVRLNDDASLKDIVLLSVGTGQATRPISEREATSWGPLEWAIPIIDVLFDGSADSVDYIAGQILGNGAYFRLQTPLTRGYDDFDSVDQTNLMGLRRTAEAHLERKETQAALDRLVSLL
ncbi:MAG TPA: patatin-like phospholipase family protein [Xanthomonadaceae bacterium]|nr:patatin-like phospholipase family protein [Xanthomonadaceae bacterium]